MLAFLETPRFNTEIRYGARGGPEFRTEIVTVTSGAEQRNVGWADSRGQWQSGDDVYTREELDSLIAFFRERMGRAGGFRFKDWSDWEVAAVTSKIGTITGSTTTFQLQKKYVNGANTVYRDIKKPVPDTVTIYNGSGVALVAPTIDYTTGIVTLSAGDYSAYTWTGEFDVPARFDVDRFDSEFNAYEPVTKRALYTVNGLTIVETR